MKREEFQDIYWYETVGYGEIRSFKSLRSALVKIDLIDCVAKVIDGQISDAVSDLPYCFISGTNIVHDDTVAIAVINKVDFLNAWRIDKEYWEYDCYLQYKPTPILSKLFPQFEFSVYRKGGSPIHAHNFVPVARFKGLERYD
jgi:hypothetical protein